LVQGLKREQRRQEKQESGGELSWRVDVLSLIRQNHFTAKASLGATKAKATGGRDPDRISKTPVWRGGVQAYDAVLNADNLGVSGYPPCTVGDQAGRLSRFRIINVA
jgi:hypothetical protein